MLKVLSKCLLAAAVVSLALIVSVEMSQAAAKKRAASAVAGCQPAGSFCTSNLCIGGNDACPIMKCGADGRLTAATPATCLPRYGVVVPPFINGLIICPARCPGGA